VNDKSNKDPSAGGSSEGPDDLTNSTANSPLQQSAYQAIKGKRTYGKPRVPQPLSFVHHIDSDGDWPSNRDSFTSSPLADVADLSLDSQGSFTGNTDHHPQKAGATNGAKSVAGRVLESIDERQMRAASPAKRTRAEMEEGHRESQAEGTPDGREAEMQVSGVGRSIHVKSHLMPQHGMPTPAPSDTQEAKDTPPLAEQLETVMKLIQEQPKEGDAGYIVSWKWVEKAQKLAQGVSKAGEKDGGSGDSALGPVDNTGLNMVTDPSTKHFKDERGHPFVPMRPGLAMKEDIEILPQAAWDLVIKWHGVKKGSAVIVRYCHNTSTSEFMENLAYELYPPVFTIFKLPGDGTATLSLSPLIADSPPVKILASRHDKYQDFLEKAKTAAKIDMSTNVRIWRFLGGTASQAQLPSGAPTPMQSRSASPAPNAAVPIDLGRSLRLSVSAFISFQEGSQRELLDVKDQTSSDSVSDNSNLDQAGLGQEGVLVLEEQIGGPAGGEWVSATAAARAKGSVPIKIKAGDTLKPGLPTSSGRSSPVPGMMTRGRARKDGKSKGTVGLSNLGNTCYMNSALQCIRSVAELSEYFLGDFYKAELNPSNPLGHHGDVARAYAALVKELYKPDASNSFAPRNLRQVIGKYNPSFSGYQQQDSQEFLLFLLDGLQEDLNRIHQKPYIEKPDSTDAMVHDQEALKRFADENWRIYKARNDSVITDLFAGMYKSTLKCPACGKVSIIFDPYNNLTLQLPVENIWAKHVLFFPQHARPVKLPVEVDKGGTILDLRTYIAKKLDVPLDKLVLAEIYGSSFYKIFHDSEAIGEIREGDVVAAYHVEAKPTNLPAAEKKTFHVYRSSSADDDDEDDFESPLTETLLVPVLFRQDETSHYTNTVSKKTFGHPSFITLTREEARSYDVILRKVLDRVLTMTTMDFLDELVPRDIQDNDGEDSDTVLMSNEDAETTNDKIHDSSVESEDGVVDVSMRESDELAVPRISYPPSQPIDRELHPGLKAPGKLPPQAGNIFEMKVWKDKSSRIPTGMGGPRSEKEYIRLKSRLPKRAPLQTERKPGQQLRRAIAHGGSPSSSEDELGLPPAISRHAASEDSDDSDGMMAIHEKVVPTGPSDDYGKAMLVSLPELLLIPRLEEADISTADETEEDLDEVMSDDPLIRLKEALVLDWTDKTYEIFFDGRNGDSEFMGEKTWDNETDVPDPELDRKRMRRAQRKKDGVSLDDCLDEFGKPEILSESDAWYCPQCKEFRRASKTFELWKLPDVLVIHLKRFAVQGRFRDKLDVQVNFPVEGLDLGSRIAVQEDGKEPIYDLFAVDNHFGGLGGGHYTAYARNAVDDAWYYYDGKDIPSLHIHPYDPPY